MLKNNPILKIFFGLILFLPLFVAGQDFSGNFKGFSSTTPFSFYKANINPSFTATDNKFKTGLSHTGPFLQARTFRSVFSNLFLETALNDGKWGFGVEASYFLHYFSYDYFFGLNLRREILRLDNFSVQLGATGGLISRFSGVAPEGVFFMNVPLLGGGLSVNSAEGFAGISAYRHFLDFNNGVYYLNLSGGYRFAIDEDLTLNASALVSAINYDAGTTKFGINQANLLMEYKEDIFGGLGYSEKTVPQGKIIAGVNVLQNFQFMLSYSIPFTSFVALETFAFNVAYFIPKKSG